MSAGEVTSKRTLEEDYQPGTDEVEDYQPGPELHREISADVDRSVAASVILDEMDDVESPEVFRLDGERASVSQGQEYEDVYEIDFSEVEDSLSDDDILDAYAVRVALGDADHFSGNYVASDSSIVPIDFEQDSHPVTSLCTAERYLKDGSDDAPDVEIDDEEIRPYLVSRVQELAESVDLDMVETRLRTRYDIHRDLMGEEPKGLPSGARDRIESIEMTRNLEEHI